MYSLFHVGLGSNIFVSKPKLYLIEKNEWIDQSEFYMIEFWTDVLFEESNSNKSRIDKVAIINITWNWMDFFSI